MVNNNKWNVYNYGDLITGEKIKIEASISPNSENLAGELKELTNLEISIDDNLIKLQEEEEGAYNEIVSSIDKWIETAKKVRLHKMALDFNNIKIPPNTNNEWVIEKGSFFENQEISNNVYKMHIRIYKNKNYRTDEIDSYEVSYYLYSRGFNDNPNSYSNSTSTLIASQERKKFDTEEKMLKYIDGRKKYYSKYFNEINPFIPKEYQRLFTVNGLLVNGYRVEE